MVGTVVQRAHYFGVSKNLPVLTDPKQFKGLTVVTSPDPNTNFSVTKKLLLDNGLKPAGRYQDPRSQSGHGDRRYAGRPG